MQYFASHSYNIFESDVILRLWFSCSTWYFNSSSISQISGIQSQIATATAWRLAQW